MLINIDIHVTRALVKVKSVFKGASHNKDTTHMILMRL